MLKSDPQRRELTLPVDAVAGLREALENELGVDDAARVLRRAGAAAGQVLAGMLAGGGGPDAVRAMPGGTFWARFSDLLAQRGWGRLQHASVDDGLGALDATDWAEARWADEDVHGGQCHFSAGMISSLLGYAAGAEVAVAEIECRASGDARCRFVFGAPTRVEAARARAMDRAEMPA